MSTWTTKNNLLPPLCYTSVISLYILNIVLIPLVIKDNTPQQRFSLQQVETISEWHKCTQLTN